MSKETRRILAEAGIFLALSAVLEGLTGFLPKMPLGGKFVSLGMIPILIFSLLRGGWWGMLMGAGFGFIMTIMDFYAIHPVQYILDYPLAFGLVGVAGFFRYEKRDWMMYAGIIAGNALRFFSHLLSGVFFFKMTMPPSFTNVWIWSAAYNSFVIPTTVVCLIIVPYLVKRLRKYNL